MKHNYDIWGNCILCNKEAKLNNIDLCRICNYEIDNEIETLEEMEIKNGKF